MHIMSIPLKQEWCFIQLLSHTTVDQVKALVKTITDKQLLAICEIVLNILQANLCVTPQKLKHLKKNKTFLRGLASKEISLGKKRRALQSKYKVIVYLLQAVRPLLETIVKQ